MSSWRSSTAAALAACVVGTFLSVPLLPVASMADGIDGFTELDYDNSAIKSKDFTGKETDSDFTDFTHKYYITLNKTFLPNLSLNAGGIFDRTYSSSTSDQVKTKSMDTDINMFSNLILSSPIYDASAGYNKRVEKTSPQGSIPVALVNEDYNVFLGWKPDLFPSMDLRLSRTNLYDYRRVLQDLTTDLALFNVKYIPVRQVDLRYSATYTNPKDKLNNTDTKDLLQAARATYTDTIFDKRSLIYLNYNFSDRDTKTTTGGAGTVTTQLTPLSGLSLVEGFTDMPIKDTLQPNPALIDGSLTTSAGIDIGFSPTLSGDTQFRDMGFGFADNTNVMNTIYVWVDKNLPANVSNSFSWQVYMSGDNINWTLVDPAPTVVFSTFQNRFEITFTPRTGARFIKVITKPLNPAVTSAPQFSDIFVTELQAFLVVPASEVKGKKSETTSVFNASTKTKILGTPYLSHDFSLYLTTASHGARTTYFLTNGLSLNQKLSRYFTVNARAAREDSELSTGHEGSFVYTASVAAMPFNTLSHSLVYSGRTDSKPTGTSDTNSITLFNKATLYQGIDAYLGLGVNFGRQETGQATQGRLVNFGASFVPHRAMTINITYVYNSSRQSGGGLPASSSINNRADASVSYAPVRALYLFASVSRQTTSSLKKTLVNYGVNFSPFPDGDLQFHFAYAENIGPAAGEGTTRLITPTLRWNIRRGAYLDISYTISETRAAAQSTDEDIFNASLKFTI